MRVEARTGDVDQCRARWKAVWKRHKEERRAYNQELCERALRRDWMALRTCRRPQARAWQDTAGGRRLGEQGRGTLPGDLCPATCRGTGVFSDALYMAHLPHATDSFTVLLAKTAQPDTWGQTRPITLSSAVLKAFSQLLLGRCRHLLLDAWGFNGLRRVNRRRSSYLYSAGWGEWQPTGR